MTLLSSMLFPVMMLAPTLSVDRQAHTAYRRAPEFSATITATGSIHVQPGGGGDPFTVSSSFSLPLYIAPQIGGDPANSCPTASNCPAFSDFTGSGASGWSSSVKVVADPGGRGWNVSAREN